MSHSPFLTPFFLFIKTPCHSPPLTSRAKGGSKPTYSPPFLLMWKKHSADLIYTEVTKLPLSSCWIFKHICQWSTWLYELPITKDSYLHQLSNQVDLHMRLKYPTKWVYTFQLSYPTKWVYKIWQVLTWLNITILHHGSQQDLFIKIQIWPFMTNTRKSSRERTYFRTLIMPTLHYSHQS